MTEKKKVIELDMACKSRPKRDYLWFTEAELRAYYKKQDNLQLEIENVKIESVRFGHEDHGILDFSVSLAGDGWGIGYGGCCLDDKPGQTFVHEREPAIECAFVLTNFLNVVGELNHCEGKHLRALKIHYGRVFALGDILQDRWFCVDLCFDLVRGHRLINNPRLDDMLYPQMEHKFERTILKEDWQWLQDEAHYLYYKAKHEKEIVHPDVVAHWESIIDGQIPFGFKIGDGF